MANPIKKALPVVTVKKAYFGKWTTTTGTKTFEAPKYLENVTEVGFEKNYGSSTWYAEGEAKISNNFMEGIPVTLSAGDIVKENELYMFGHKESATGGVIRSTNDRSAQGVFRFIEQTADSKFLVTTLWNGSFVPGGRTTSTAEGSANYQVKQLNGNFNAIDLSETLLGITDTEEIFETLEAAIAYCTSTTLPTVKPAS